jgi:hypothetical protein
MISRKVKEVKPLLLGMYFKTCRDGEEATLLSNPGVFYACLGQAVATQQLALVLPDHMKIAWWCYRQAAVGRCRMAVSKPVLKERVVSSLEPGM